MPELGGAPDMRRWHDMGGRLDLLEHSEINRDEHDYALWEKRVDALVIIAGLRGVFSVDALRRILEDAGAEQFASKSYYERWIGAVTQGAIESGVVSIEELRAKMAEVQARGWTYGAAANRTSEDASGAAAHKSGS